MEVAGSFFGCVGVDESILGRWGWMGHVFGRMGMSATFCGANGV